MTIAPFSATISCGQLMFSACASGTRRKSANAPVSQDFMMISSYLLNPNNNLPHEVAAFHVFIGGRRVIELENAVNQRVNIILADEHIHRLEVLARAYVNAA